MTIDFMNFTPWESFFGGTLIGFAALLLMLSKGRIMGVSGILSGIIKRDIKSDWLWRIFFILGAMFGPFLLIFITNNEIPYKPVAGGILFLVAAFLVGIGTSLGSGCTSGHGICGLSLMSKRSFFSVLTFIFTGVITVLILEIIS